MSDTPDDRAARNQNHLRPRARSIPVHFKNVLLVGWVVRADVVLVQAGGLDRTAKVEINGILVPPLTVRFAGDAFKGWEPWTALILKPDTLPMKHDAFPPGLECQDDDDDFGAAPWCKILPWFPGC
ncbi:hypothetical protein [Glutamicibacter sp. NPDC087344]|uniref:hypothetical protein n=1 Tax=Glutamicibacter sp. NPDC087344 TaxID=3363994 RepID=UPI00381928AB